MRWSNIGYSTPLNKCKWTKCGFSKRLSSEHWSSVAWLDFPLLHHQSFPLESWNIIFYVFHVGQSYSYWKDISRICGKVQSSLCPNLWWLWFPKGPSPPHWSKASSQYIIITNRNVFFNISAFILTFVFDEKFSTKFKWVPPFGPKFQNSCIVGC